MENNFIKKLMIEMKIETYLDDINGYADSTYCYLTETNYNLDKEEILMYLSSIEEIIVEIKNLIFLLEKSYEDNMKEAVNIYEQE